MLRAVSRLNALTRVRLSYCDNVTDEGLLELRSLAALTTLLLYGFPNVTDAGKQALRTALPNLTIEGRWAVGQAAAMPPFSPCLPARSTQCPHAEQPPVQQPRKLRCNTASYCLISFHTHCTVVSNTPHTPDLSLTHTIMQVCP